MGRRPDPLREIDRMFRAIDLALFGRAPRPARRRPAPPSVTPPLRDHAAADVALREETIEALVAEGVPRPVAAERTNSPAKLRAEALRLEIV